MKTLRMVKVMKEGESEGRENLVQDEFTGLEEHLLEEGMLPTSTSLKRAR